MYITIANGIVNDPLGMLDAKGQETSFYRMLDAFTANLKSVAGEYEINPQNSYIGYMMGLASKKPIPKELSQSERFFSEMFFQFRELYDAWQSLLDPHYPDDSRFCWSEPIASYIITAS